MSADNKLQHLPEFANWKEPQWQNYWTRLLNIRDYRKVPEVALWFYWDFFLSAGEAPSQAALTQLEARYKDLLEPESKVVIPTIIAARRQGGDTFHQSYLGFNHATGITEKPSRYEHSDEIPNITVEMDPRVRLRNARAMYQFVADTYAQEQTVNNNRVEIGSIKILSHLAGITDHGLLADHYINSWLFQRQLAQSNKGQDEFFAMIYLLDEGSRAVNHLNSGDSKTVANKIQRGFTYFEKNLPQGQTLDSINQQFPVVIAWLQYRISSLFPTALPAKLSALAKVG